jgi:hypothetical protein
MRDFTATLAHRRDIRSSAAENTCGIEERLFAPLQNVTMRGCKLNAKSRKPHIGHGICQERGLPQGWGSRVDDGRAMQLLSSPLLFF